MIPGFLALANNQNAALVSRPLPVSQELNYEELAEFEEVSDNKDYSILSHVVGNLNGLLEVGYDDDGMFGYRVTFQRFGVHGTLLVDRLEFDVATMALGIERCPDVMEELEESSSVIITFPDS